jgi:hypothetical protein
MQALAIKGSACKNSMRNTQGLFSLSVELYKYEYEVHRHPNHSIQVRSSICGCSGINKGELCTEYLRVSTWTSLIHAVLRTVLASVRRTLRTTAGIGCACESRRCASGEKTWVLVKGLRCGTAKIQGGCQ